VKSWSPRTEDMSSMRMRASILETWWIR
jgi:hypothetical protein